MQEKVDYKCDIVIPVWNLKEWTQRCVESIIVNTEYPYRLIIIDNGSEKPTRDYLVSLKQDKRLKYYLFIRNEKNLGCTKAINQGMKAASSEYILVLNNDTIVCSGWLSELVRIAQLSGDIGIVNPNSNNLGAKKPWHMSLEQYARKIMEKYKGRYIEMSAAVGFCSLIKKEVVERVGVYDEGFGMGNFDDTEYSIRARQAGFKTVFAKGPYVYHKEHASFDLLGDFDEFFGESQKVFYEKFGRPERLLYILSRQNKEYFKKLKKQTHDLADNLNWVRIFIKTHLKPPDLAEHTNIVLIPISFLFFRIHCVFNVLVKKKKYARIFVDDGILLDILKKLKRFHKAEVNPIL
ncbi:MAG: glycosyltransferase family 2 protein [Candidatus Omnitrophica bacterium]|nr:glycosyltransferase family 2 protein [Candidatus Omnitrophota bacterium]